jgi:hypothetical protein
MGRNQEEVGVIGCEKTICLKILGSTFNSIDPFTFSYNDCQ